MSRRNGIDQDSEPGLSNFSAPVSPRQLEEAAWIQRAWVGLILRFPPAPRSPGDAL